MKNAKFEFFFFHNRVGRGLLYSEDSESGEVLRKRFRGSSRDEDEELDSGAMRGKRKHKSWNDPEASSSYSHEVSARQKNTFVASHFFLFFILHQGYTSVMKVLTSPSQLSLFCS